MLETDFHQKHDSAGGDELCAREHSKNVILLQCQTGFTVGMPIAEAIDHLTPTQQRGRNSREKLFVDLSAHRGVQCAEIRMGHGFRLVSDGRLLNSAPGYWVSVGEFALNHAQVEVSIAGKQPAARCRDRYCDLSWRWTGGQHRSQSGRIHLCEPVIHLSPIYPEGSVRAAKPALTELESHLIRCRPRVSGHRFH